MKPGDLVRYRNLDYTIWDSDDLYIVLSIGYDEHLGKVMKLFGDGTIICILWEEREIMEVINESD